MVIEFYEKPGCGGNARQKEKLQSLGCLLSVKNLLATKWDKRELAEYFVGKSVHEWFNLSAPSVKDGLISVDAMSESEALEAMIKEPILIKRPLIKSGLIKISGFDPDELKQKLGLDVVEAPATCLADDACNQVL